MTAGKTQGDVRIRYEASDVVDFWLTGLRPSVSCTFYARLGLTRDVLRKALAELGDRRGLRVMLCSILRYSRFKYFLRKRPAPGSQPEVWRRRQLRPFSGVCGSTAARPYEGSGSNNTPPS